MLRKSVVTLTVTTDISAELLNKCINSAGIDYYSESEMKELKVANQESKLKLEFEIDNNTSEQSVSQLFEKIDDRKNILKSSPELLEKFPSYRNYILWRNKLKVAFVSVCDIPNYDLEANKKLDEIIKQLKSIIQ